MTSTRSWPTSQVSLHYSYKGCSWAVWGGLPLPSLPLENTTSSHPANYWTTSSITKEKVSVWSGGVSSCIAGCWVCSLPVIFPRTSPILRLLCWEWCCRTACTLGRGSCFGKRGNRGGKRKRGNNHEGNRSLRSTISLSQIQCLQRSPTKSEPFLVEDCEWVYRRSFL